MSRPESCGSIFERRWQRRWYTTADGTPALCAYVFHRNGRPVCPTLFGRQWRAACIAAELGRRDEKSRYFGKLFHDLRRTAARDMIRSGVPQSVAMQVTGHETASMFQRYAIVGNDDKLTALERRQAFIGQAPAESNVRAFRVSDTSSDTEALTH